MSLIEDNDSFIFDAYYEGNTNPEDFDDNLGNIQIFFKMKNSRI